MKAAQHQLNDPPQEAWQEGYQKEIHAMVLLAYDDEPSLRLETSRLLDDVKIYAEICAVEHGRVMRDAHGQSVEHFGHVIGRSQPLFFQRDVERERQRGGIDQWNPSAGPSLVLVKDPHGGEGAYGSYLVFRKLEQNVRGFRAREAVLASVLGLTNEDMQRAGAYVVGRFQDGTPVALQSTPGQPTSMFNNFTYDIDPRGLKCPFHAHIRKVNLRDNIASAKDRRIVRQGIAYGVRTPDIDDNPTGGVGLLFMCYQKNIEGQFEFLQPSGPITHTFLQRRQGSIRLSGNPIVWKCMGKDGQHSGAMHRHSICPLVSLALLC